MESQPIPLQPIPLSVAETRVLVQMDNDRDDVEDCASADENTLLSRCRRRGLVRLVKDVFWLTDLGRVSVRAALAQAAATTAPPAYLKY